MKIIVNEITIESTEQGYPFWFRMTDGNHVISFTQREAKAIYDALGNCIEEVKKLDKS